MNSTFSNAAFKAITALCCLSAVFFIGCATTLPNISTVEKGTAAGNPPEIVGPHGKLSPGRAAKVLSALQHSGSADLLQANISLMESLSGHPLTAGNHVTLLVDGPATYAAMMEAITEAKDHINFETYVFEDDEIGQHFANTLLQKQAKGVQVNLIYDAVGSMHTPAAFFQRLRDIGVNVLQFNPINPVKAKGEPPITRRDHRKLMVVDGKVAFTGGVNISSAYSSSSGVTRETGEKNAGGWRDTHVRIEGPAVAQFQELFLDTWHNQKGPPLAERDYFPPLQQKGKEFVEAIGSTPGEMNRLTYIMYVSAIRHAARSIHLTNAYFVPDHQTMETLVEAAACGVDIKVILPGSSNETLVFYAGRSHYEDLLEAGVKLYERRARMVHAKKTAVIDGVWSTVGSTNLDLWSFMRNNEINAIILGANFAGQMEDIFSKDLAASDEITLETWSRRSIIDRLRELFARLMSHWL